MAKALGIEVDIELSPAVVNLAADHELQTEVLAINACPGPAGSESTRMTNRSSRIAAGERRSSDKLPSGADYMAFYLGEHLGPLRH